MPAKSCGAARRDDDPEEYCVRWRSHALRRPNQDRIDRKNGMARRDEDRKEHREGNDADLRGMAQAEQQQEDRQKRDLRDRIEERHQRVEEIAHAAGMSPAPSPGDDSRRRSNRKSREDAVQARGQRYQEFTRRPPAPTIRPGSASAPKDSAATNPDARTLPMPPERRTGTVQFKIKARVILTLPPPTHAPSRPPPAAGPRPAHADRDTLSIYGMHPSGQCAESGCRP